MTTQAIRALACAAVLAALPAAADDALPIELTWRAPDGCPTAADVRARIERLVSSVPNASPVAERVVARAEVTHAEDRLLLVIVVDADGATGTRRVDSSACEDLADAAALIVALAYDPDVAALPPAKPVPAPVPHDTAPAPTPAPPPTAPAPLPPAAPSPALPAPEAVERVVPSVGLGGVAVLGALPTATAGGHVELGLAYAWLNVALDGALWLSRESRIAGTTAGAELDFQSVGARVCGRLLAQPVELSGCARIDVGRMHARGFGVDESLASTAVWAAAGPALRAALPIGDRLATSLELAGVASLTRPEWRLQGLGTIDDPGVIAGRAALGMEVRF